MALPQVESLLERCKALALHLDLESKIEEAAVLEKRSTDEDFWEDNDKAQEVLKSLRILKDWIEGCKGIENGLNDVQDIYEMALAEGDVESKEAALDDLINIEHDLRKLELLKMLDGEDDACGAIISIAPGAGGTESQDWAEMLMRMYMRYFDKKKWKYKILDYQDGEEAGVKSVTLEIDVDFAFGNLRSELGVHRLVRISPFDSSARRHTSFVAVDVTPLLEDIEYEIHEKDIRVDVYRASGAGGQHVNKTDSAVRMTHIPTGLVTSCQAERSQIKNRAQALKVLTAMVYQRQKEEELAKRADKKETKQKIEWGSQIRSYVLQPYQMVKDLRSNYETSDTSGVLDGDIEAFSEAYLLMD
jgi:peptide chain release factor 2